MPVVPKIKTTTQKMRGAKKLRRVSKLKNYYAGNYIRVAANKKRKLRHHLEDHPSDTQARHAYEQKLNFGSTAGFELSRRRRKHLESRA